MTYSSFLFVGCGNMGGAMLDGWLAAGIDPATFTIADPGRETAPDGVTLQGDIPENAFDAVLIGIKPDMLPDLAETIRKATGPDTRIFSVLAGVEVATLRRYFPDVHACVRVMPNLASKVGKSPIALAGEGIDPATKEEVRAFFDHLGTAEWLDGEGHFDLVTALAGSGPAFVYRFIDALAKGANNLGLPEDQALRLATAMVEGAATLAERSDITPGELADRVASPGGTTRAGMDVMDADDRVFRLMEDTLRAASERSAEMAAESREKG